MASEDKSNDKGRKKEEEKTMEQEVKDMKLDYQPKSASGMPTEISDEAKKEMEKTRERLEKFKKEVLKKYQFTLALGILPPQGSEIFEEEEEVPEEDRKQKPIHLIMVIPEDNFKDIPKIKPEIIKMVKDMKPKVWVHVKTPVDIFNYCLDSKYDVAEFIGMSFPLFDKGLLGALRVAEIHKSLCLRKFEKYVASYIIAGSLVRGTTTKTSDVDVYIVIDDTDVKRMPSIE